MYISFNASAVIANNSLNKADNKLQNALARLSSGLKVVNPKDNPSGLAMAKRMNAQIAGVTQANANAGDGISIIEIADGTLSELTEMIQRINELATKGANGTMTDEDRELIDQEVQQLKGEIDRLSKDTSFNGQPILDGSFDLKGYTQDKNLKVSYYSDAVTYGEYQLSGLEVNYNADGTIDTVTGGTIKNKDGEEITGLTTKVYGNTITFTDGKNWELKMESHQETTETQKKYGDPNPLTISLLGIGAMDMQIGSNEGQQLGIRIPKMSLENMELSKVSCGTKEESEETLDRVNAALRYVSSARANLGAYQNRLEHTIKSLDITNENMTSAYSRIMDVDMAEEMTEYTTLQILSQASTSMLAQANERPSQVLQLLQ